MKAIAFYNNKGGVGKTTLSTQLAVFSGAYQNLIGSELRVLFIDLDEQMNSTQFLSPVAPDPEYFKSSINQDIGSMFEYSICDVIKDNNFDVRKAIVKSIYPNVDMIPGNLNIKKVASEVENDPTSFGQLILNRQIRKLEKEYEFVFIDCPPTKAGGETAMGMMLADAVVIPILADVYSFYGLSSCYEMIENVSKTAYKYTQHHLINLGIVLNQYQPNGSMDKHFLNQLLPLTDFPFSGITIHKAAKVSQNAYVHEPIINAKRAKAGLPQTSPIANDLYELALYIFSSLKKGHRNVKSIR